MPSDNRSCIYAIENHETGSLYIGSTTAFYRRKTEHLWMLRRQQHTSRHLQNAWDKYGEESFSFYVLEPCDPSELLIREQSYLDTFKPEYNICLIAGRVTSPEIQARR